MLGCAELISTSSALAFESATYLVPGHTSVAGHGHDHLVAILSWLEAAINAADRAGDLDFIDAEGQLHFLVRKDHQIKIQGMRVEPGEIESVLQQHVEIDPVAVTAFDAGSGGKSLVANLAVVPRAELTQAALLGHCRHCRRNLPLGYVPDFVRILERMPLTSSGKIDRRAIPAFVLPIIEGAAHPETATQQQAAEIRAALLQRPVEDLQSLFSELHRTKTWLSHLFQVARLGARSETLGVMEA